MDVFEPVLGRMDWDEYFFQIAEKVAERSTCLRRRIGAVIVSDHLIVSTGYNGAPSSMRHCTEIGCIRDKLKIDHGKRHEMCRALHAEQNALISAARKGWALDRAIIYTTTFPCVICTKLIMGAGIGEIHFDSEYPDPYSMDLIKEHGKILLKRRGEGKWR